MKNDRDYYPPRKSEFDILVMGLCSKIDRLQTEVDYWMQRTEDAEAELATSRREQMDSVMQGVGNAIMFAMSIQDGPDGSLVISKENRKDLANHYRNKSSDPA